MTIISPPLLSIYDINQLEVMWMADLAWRKINTSTICNCWSHVGILPEASASVAPLMPSVPVASLLNAEQDIVESLGLLEKMGVLLGQPLNCILQPHPKIMAEHQVIVGSHKEISLERRRRMGEYASSY